jgi:hypothetical protein
MRNIIGGVFLTLDGVVQGPGGTLPAFPPFGPQPSTSSREAERQRRMAEGSW